MIYVNGTHHVCIERSSDELPGTRWRVEDMMKHIPLMHDEVVELQKSQ